MKRSIIRIVHIKSEEAFKAYAHRLLDAYPSHEWYHIYYHDNDYSCVYMTEIAADAIAQAAGLTKIECI